MGRILFQYLLPIILPTVVYFAWLAAERRRVERAGTGEAPHWRDAPWVWLAGCGVALALVIVFASAFFGGADTSGRYVPPRVEDGRVIPGHVVPDPAQ